MKALNITEWWALTVSNIMGWNSFNGKNCVFVWKWYILSAQPLYGHFENRTHCAWSAPLTLWVIPIYFPHYSSYSLLSLFHNVVLSTTTHPYALRTYFLSLACLVLLTYFMYSGNFRTSQTLGSHQLPLVWPVCCHVYPWCPLDADALGPVSSVRISEKEHLQAATFPIFLKAFCVFKAGCIHFCTWLMIGKVTDGLFVLLLQLMYRAHYLKENNSIPTLPSQY